MPILHLTVPKPGMPVFPASFVFQQHFKNGNHCLNIGLKFLKYFRKAVSFSVFIPGFLRTKLYPAV